MTVSTRSVIAWIAGGVIGSVVAKERKVVGALLGAFVIGGIADAAIERGERTPPRLPSS